MPWTPDRPNDFSTFKPSDFLRFLEWWELQQSNLLAIELADVFLQGLTEPWLELASPTPNWVVSILKLRLLAQWAYQAGEPIAAKVERGIEGLIPDGGYSTKYKVTPKDIAEIPPAVRQAFLEGQKFSLSWVKNLSTEARSQISDLLAINTLKNRDVNAIVPVLEQVLRRDRVAEELGLTADEITPEQIKEWTVKAQFTVLENVAKRAQLISQTESMRMMNLGILSTMEVQGEKLVYVMPHRGTCPDCQRLLDGRVFRISILKENLFKNFGVPRLKWVASMPQHPRCRHSPMPIPYSFKEAFRSRIVPPEGVVLEHYGLPGGEEAMKELGLLKQEWLQANGKFG